MSVRPVWTFVVLLAVAGCGEPPCLDADGIVPGVGASTDGASFCLGDSAEILRKRLGDEASSADLGRAGLRMRWGEPDFVGTLTTDAVTALQLGASFVGTTPEGVGVGAGEAAVRAEFGEPTVDLFGGAWLYDDAGIGFQWSDGAVVRVHLYAPAD